MTTNANMSDYIVLYTDAVEDDLDTMFSGTHTRVQCKKTQGKRLVVLVLPWVRHTRQGRLNLHVHGLMNTRNSGHVEMAATATRRFDFVGTTGLFSEEPSLVVVVWEVQ